MKENEELFQHAPVSRAVFQMAVPTVISSLVLVIYNMADTFFVGQTKDAFQVAAVSLTNPVFVMYMAIANLLGIGASALISILLGQNDEKHAKAASAFCCYGSLVFGVISGGLILGFMDPLLKILGSSSIISIRKTICFISHWERRLSCLPMHLVMECGGKGLPKLP
ncbi:MAG: MATE family efflux transporter [Lachnospiraceae bacterium]